MIDNELEEILSLVDKYIENRQSEKTWEAGKDWIYYAGPYFNSDEYVDGITTFLESKKIQTRTYFGGNVMLQPAYEHLVDTEKVIKDFPVARKVTADTFFLGTAPTITKDKIDYIENMVDLFMESL